MYDNSTPNKYSLLEMEAAKHVIAKRYSGALFDAANEAQVIDRVSADLIQLKEMFAENRQYIKLILPRVIPSKIKNVFLNTAISRIELHEITKNFLNVLIRYNRIYVIKDIMEEFEETARDHNNELDVEVKTAFEMTEERNKVVASELQGIFNKKIHLNIIVDKNVLGGLSVRVKSQLLDATLKNKLQKIKRLALYN